MTIKVLTGEALETLRTLPDQSVNCIVTSPPYYGLRDYGTATWEGGDSACDHELINTKRLPWANDVKGKATSETGKNGTGYSMMLKESGGECAKCGAGRVDQQIGLEETPDAFIAKLVDVFREARRVLRDDGVAFINIGDSYAGSGRGGYAGGKSGLQGTTNGQDNSRVARGSQLRAGFHARQVDEGAIGRAWVPPPAGLKQKDLIGIPWMLAFALRADGWFLRQDIIWHKPNPMPESVRDRCTKAHEHVFLLSKSQRYLFDAEAISEEAAVPETDPKMRTKAGLAEIGPRDRRNKRDVWTIATEPSSTPHYAMMPTELAKTCIMAGCPLGGTVLDMFGGAGTTGLVADRLQRSAILIELSPEHAGTARERLQGDMGMFGEIA